MSGRQVVGTGFFAAPGRILTCAHVVQSLGTRVNVRWNKATFYGTVEKLGNPKSLVETQPGESTDPDLALIVLEAASFGPEMRHPCVYVSQEMPALNEALYSYGHAIGEYAENGQALTLQYEGPARDALSRDMLSLKAGNVLPGMSGSPLLNQRTGRVCGVLFASRGDGTDLGGRGIPIRYAFEMFPGLADAHEAYHRDNTRWTVFWTGREPLAEAPSSDLPKVSQDAERAFQRKKAFFGVSARKFQIEKRPNLFGNSSVRYRIEDLQSDSRLSGIAIYLESVVGVIGTPAPEKESEDLIDWVPESNTRNEARPLETKIKEMRRLRGRIQFRKPLEPGQSLTFSWSVEILNQYALSDWEFQNLYGREARHFDHSKLARAMEYFPQIVWFPVECLHIHLALPPQLRAEPSLSVFLCKNRDNIQPPDVLHDGWLETHPLPESKWTPVPEGRWVRDEVEAQRRVAGLQSNGAAPATSDLVIRYPPVGTAYSLDWPLPTTFVQLVRDAEALRECLRLHRDWRLRPAGEGPSSEVHKLFRDYAEDLRQQYSTEGSEVFEVTLMTYDDANRKLIVADGVRNGDELREADWNFALPFGMGLAGACFREGNQAIRWLRREQESRFNYYLSISEKEQHEALLLVPIDHPALPLVSDLPETQEGSSGFSQRAQQVIAVVVVASDAADTKLLRLSTEQQIRDDASIDNPMSALAAIVGNAGKLGAQMAHAFGLWG